MIQNNKKNKKHHGHHGHQHHQHHQYQQHNQYSQYNNNQNKNNFEKRESSKSGEDGDESENKQAKEAEPSEPQILFDFNSEEERKVSQQELDHYEQLSKIDKMSASEKQEYLQSKIKTKLSEATNLLKSQISVEDGEASIKEIFSKMRQSLQELKQNMIDNIK